MLGSKRRWENISGLCDQSRAPRMPGPVVPAIGAVHVPMPRWRLLPGRLPSLRSAGTRTVPVRVPDRERKAIDQSRRDAYARAGLKQCQGGAIMRLIVSIWKWLDARLQLGSTIRETAEHPVPRETASWFYVFGSAAVVVFMLQIATGILLAFIYVPSAGEAWTSLQTLNHNVAFGWYVRALHGWGSDFMLAICLSHMVEGFLFGE